MRIHLDPHATAPLSAQLRDALRGRILSGRLAPGDRLPSVRALAAELGLAPNTVAKAYRELEEAGLLVARGRHGTSVVDRLPETIPDRQARLEDAARAFARRAEQLGVPPSRALDAVRRAQGRSRPARHGA